MIEKLDYLKWLGISTIWFNPCFDPAFRDAGYDVADCLRLAPRYGTNEIMETLVQEARKRGIEQSFAEFTLLLTWGSLPSIYFGDEIGMRNLPNTPEKEGRR